MTQLETLDTQNLSGLVDDQPATDAELLTKLRQTRQIASLAASLKHDKLVAALCTTLNLTVTDIELQAAGDCFRLTHQLTSAQTMLTWLDQQQVSVEDWTEELRLQLMTQKLKEALFGDQVDGHYLQNRNHFRQVALSQILVDSLPLAQQILSQLQGSPERFCELALEHSQTRSQMQGGFVGIRFVSELMPEVATAITEADAGAMIGPVESRLGIHLIKVEKWFPAQLTDVVRTTVLDALFQPWLQRIMNSG
jgi:PPIC-type PPIASE domain